MKRQHLIKRIQGTNRATWWGLVALVAMVLFFASCSAIRQAAGGMHAHKAAAQLAIPGWVWFAVGFLVVVEIIWRLIKMFKTKG